MSYVVSPQKKNKSNKKVYIILAILLMFTALFMAWWLFILSSEPEQQAIEQTQVVQEEPAVEEQTETFPDLQPVVDNWVDSHPGTYSVIITDRTGEILAQSNPNQVFFAASLYKLFVAYEGYRKIDDGTYSSGEVLQGGRTVGQCLDVMIRDSDSPCGEAMMADLGQQYLTEKMEEYGLKNTSLNGIQTTALDSALILQKIYGGVGLTAASREAYLDSMKTQDSEFRRGLPSGFVESAVYNKVGWNLDKEWHDSAIVELKDGRVIIVSVLTTSAGYRNIAGFGQALEQALQ